MLRTQQQRIRTPTYIAYVCTRVGVYVTVPTLCTHECVHTYCLSYVCQCTVYYSTPARTHWRALLRLGVPLSYPLHALRVALLCVYTLNTYIPARCAHYMLRT